MVKYKAEFYFSFKIIKCEIEKETKATVWFAGKAFYEKKETIFYQYFDTWEEAHNYLLEKAQGKVDVARLQLNKANGALGNVKGMKK